MRVLVAPVLVGDRLCRIVSPIDSLLEVEEWVGEWWEPSSVTLTAASQSPAASERVLRERGVPAADRRATGGGITEPELQSLLRACEPAMPAASPHDPTRDAACDPPAAAPRPREYPGSTRFLRGRRAAKPRAD